MKDNDLLVSELYRNPIMEAITSISVYLTPKTSNEEIQIHLQEIIFYHHLIGLIRYVR